MQLVMIKIYNLLAVSFLEKLLHQLKVNIDLLLRFYFSVLK